MNKKDFHIWTELPKEYGLMDEIITENLKRKES